ncbi:hypothetical protein ACQKM9_20095 [Viridibacillus sp. NPDC093762]|uniref:hypothetical protein n=1 Tax=Viridibacillus sp. NPDC093762 TaxID=3390720 RepID=UPI003CFCF367
MKEFNDKRLNDSLESLEKNMQLKQKYHEQQKKRVLSAVQDNIVPPQQKNKLLVSLVTIILLIFVTSPLYSTTAANFIEKLIPIKISNDSTIRIDNQTIDLVEQSGYEYQSISTSPNPFKLEIVLMPNTTSLSDMKANLMPKIEALMEKEHIDDYKIFITQYEKVQESDDENIKKQVITNKPNQNKQWPKIVSNLHSAMAGKSAYELKGISYKTEDDVTLIEIKTGLENNEDTPIIINEIKKALNSYFLQDSTKMMINNDNYEVRIYDKDMNELEKIDKFTEK